MGGWLDWVTSNELKIFSRDLDFELSFPQVRKTGGFAILSNRLFKNKTAVKIVIKYIFKSQN